MKAVIMDNIPLDYGPWLTCSPECLDFLKGLLMRDPAQRMTATEALEHPWFRRHFGVPASLCPVPVCGSWLGHAFMVLQWSGLRVDLHSWPLLMAAAACRFRHCQRSESQQHCATGAGCTALQLLQ
jgi:hypothetical protein